MERHNFTLSANNMRFLEKASRESGYSMSEYLRRMLDKAEEENKIKGEKK